MLLFNVYRGILMFNGDMSENVKVCRGIRIHVIVESIRKSLLSFSYSNDIASYMSYIS